MNDAKPYTEEECRGPYHNGAEASWRRVLATVKAFKRSEAARHWLIKRLNEECANAGFELFWTDGGGDSCPGGWHRNPYIGASSEMKLRAEKAEAALKHAQQELDDARSLIKSLLRSKGIK